jgi:hypothetical protein
MSYQPAFTDVKLSQGILTISGVSLDSSRQIEILVAVQQGMLHAEAHTERLGAQWSAKIPVASLKPWPPRDGAPTSPAPTFNPKLPTELFGSETRGGPFAAISWHQLVTIEP